MLRKYLLVLGGLILSFVIAILTGGPFTYSIFYLYLFAVIFALLYGLISHWCFSYKIRIDKDCISVGEKAIVSIEIKNRYPFFIPYVILSDSILEGNVKMGFLPLQRKTVERAIAPRNYGIFEIGDLKVDMVDGFNLFRFSHFTKKTVTLKVYPALFPIENLNLIALKQFGRTPVKEKFFEDYSSISDIRKYMVGDSFKRVDWKTSAKKSDFYVKNFELMADNSVDIFLDRYMDNFKVNSGDLDERVMECCASVVKYCFDKNIPVRIRTSCANIETQKASAFMNIMDQLIVLSPMENVRLSDFIKKVKADNDFGNTIVIITVCMDKGLLDEIAFIRDMGYGVMVFLVVNESDKANYVEYTGALNNSGVYMQVVQTS